jgi:hypothetical protein
LSHTRRRRQEAARRERQRGSASCLSLACKSTWTLLLTVKCHGGRAKATAIPKVSVPRCWLRRSDRKRLWCCHRDIRPDRIKRLLKFEDVAGAASER